MQKLFTIGEVSKIKAVSVKSLRYYGDLGILPPAYINPESGYRYYCSDQLVIVDLIKVCLDLDIPLKNFRDYIQDDGSVDVGRLLEDAHRIVTEKERKLKSSIAFLDTMSRHIMRTNKIKAEKSPFIQQIPRRFFLTTALLPSEADYGHISAKYTMLLRQCQQLGITDSFNQGVMFTGRADAVSAKVFVEIPSPETALDNLYIVEGGRFSCEVFEDTSWACCLKRLPKEPLIVKELFDLNFDMQVPLVEVQRPLDAVGME